MRPDKVCDAVWPGTSHKKAEPGHSVGTFPLQMHWIITCRQGLGRDTRLLHTLHYHKRWFTTQTTICSSEITPRFNPSVKNATVGQVGYFWWLASAAGGWSPGILHVPGGGGGGGVGRTSVYLQPDRLQPRVWVHFTTHTLQLPLKTQCRRISELTQPRQAAAHTCHAHAKGRVWASCERSAAWKTVIKEL